MARAAAASASANFDSAKGGPRTVARRRYRPLLTAEPLLRRAVPALIVAFIVTVGVGAVVQVLAQRHQALTTSTVMLNAAAEIAAERINTRTNSAVTYQREALISALPAWALSSGRHFILTKSDGIVIAAVPDGSLIGQRFTTSLGADTSTLTSIRRLNAPFGQLIVTQPFGDAIANGHALTSLTTTLMTTTGCMVLILGFAYHWQARRAREIDLRYEKMQEDVTKLEAEKAALIECDHQLTAPIADLRAYQDNTCEGPGTRFTNKRAAERWTTDEPNRIKSKFLAEMSYELRTPLNAIIGFSEIMKLEMFGPLGADKYREYCGDIHETGKSLLRIVRDVLDTSERETEWARRQGAKGAKQEAR